MTELLSIGRFWGNACCCTKDDAPRPGFHNCDIRDLQLTSSVDAILTSPPLAGNLMRFCHGLLYVTGRIEHRVSYQQFGPSDVFFHLRPYPGDSWQKKQAHGPPMVILR